MSCRLHRLEFFGLPIAGSLGETRMMSRLMQWRERPRSGWSMQERTRKSRAAVCWRQRTAEVSHGGRCPATLKGRLQSLGTWAPDPHTSTTRRHDDGQEPERCAAGGGFELWPFFKARVQVVRGRFGLSKLYMCKSTRAAAIQFRRVARSVRKRDAMLLGMAGGNHMYVRMPWQEACCRNIGKDRDK